MATDRERVLEDLICVMVSSFVELSVEDVAQDVEDAAKLMCSLFSEYSGHDFCGHFLRLLDNLKDRNSVCFYQGIEKFLFHVRDKFVFKFLLLVSLKYNRRTFVESETPTRFIQTVLQEAVETVDIRKNLSLHLLRLTEIILKKRHDYVLTPELSLLVLKHMNRAAYSPFAGFKHVAQNVSRMVLGSLPQDVRKEVCNLHHLPIKGIDLNDIFKYFERDDFLNNLDFINKKILQLFCNNTESREGSFFYEALLKIFTFDEFVATLWPYYRHCFRKFDEGEFYQSFLKYWIPITVKRFNHRFYDFIRHEDIDYQLKAYTLLETRKRGSYYKDFDTDTLTFLKYPKTSKIGLNIVATYARKQMWPDEFDLRAVRFYMIHYSQSEFSDSDLKIWRQFISQIFLVIHISESHSDNVDLSMYTAFLEFVYNFCVARISDEVAPQILEVIWDVALGSSERLATCYTIDMNNKYGHGTNLYFAHLQRSKFWELTFSNPHLQMRITEILAEYEYRPLLLNFVRKFGAPSIMEGFCDFSKLLTDSRDTVSLPSSEKIRAYVNCVFTRREPKTRDLLKSVKDVEAIFAKTIEHYDSQNLFTLVLCLDIMNTALRFCPNINHSDLIKKSCGVIDQILDENFADTLDTKNAKVLESFINNVLEAVSLTRHIWKVFTKEDLFQHLCRIIQFSNMKRPVSLAARRLITVSRAVHSSSDRELIQPLLHQTLNLVYENNQSGKIRRNPETRMIIYALCSGDIRPGKPLLNEAITFLLERLSDPSSSDSTLASSLNSLEVLVSDSILQPYTLPFIVDLIKHCIRLFNGPSWIVRNADVQLLKALVERFLGVSLDENVRPKTIENLFVLFPELISYFYSVLSAPELNDSAMVVLEFFAESQTKNDFFIQESLGLELKKFRKLFLEIGKNYSNSIGYLAVKALTSLCPNAEVPETIVQIVVYIERFYSGMRKNVFSNLIALLGGLLQKYKTSLDRSGDDHIDRVMRSLKNFLKARDCFHFSLLPLKLYSVDELSEKVIATLTDGNTGYEERIWLNNYAPYLFMKIDLPRLGSMLNKVFACNISQSLEEQIVAVVLERSIDENLSIVEVIKILVLRLTTLRDYDDKFLISLYSKSILLLVDELESNVFNDIIVTIRDSKTDSIFKMFIYVLVLAHCTCRCEEDDVFVSKCIQTYIEHLYTADDEILFGMSKTMIHLYKIATVAERFNVMKIIFYLLLNYTTSAEMCNVMSWLSHSYSPSPLITAVNLLKFNKLVGYLGEKELAREFLTEVYYFVRQLPDGLEESDTYFPIENEFSLSKQCVMDIIFNSLIEDDGSD